MRTQVAIVGAGPAGLVLAHLLRATGIESVVIERRTRDYVEGRVRAGVLEQGTVAVLARLGLDRRLRAEGLVHTGTNLAMDGETVRIAMADLTGSAVTIYGQQEVMRDLFDAAETHGMPIVFEAEDVRLHDIDSASPSVSYRTAAGPKHLACDFVAGCDGSHGTCRQAIPEAVRKTFERVYPFGWLGILAEVPPAAHELIYASHANGFALSSMRSPTRSRYYIQCGIDERVEDWPDDRFWDELCLRLGPETAAGVVRGSAFEKSIAPLRSFVGEPMRHGRLFLAGDAAHSVPPTGAKGINLAVSDVLMLAEALEDFYARHDQSGLDGYSARALARVWKAERFSWWFTGLTHRFPEATGFDRRMQVAEFAYLRTSRAAQTAFAENYIGLPLDPSTGRLSPEARR
ncbi:4-hydroxybenzoate 3-monooxygenase [Methylobacterium sp. J-048]|uniref:4-hydroxybenzoate 3-monooxygenase n=1 Tax=Methylobacterium sp. J-048 TaxID=2836635 RepID=UPI001FB9E6FA|nr:4-hydroxybenzoate 3-monooxygenase [Methylobacterium sp. J-048]MCJ2058706.1 4-hydroxybenzoate 3-monooxygenase [Methylobacterium sp. J-048]